MRPLVVVVLLACVACSVATAHAASTAQPRHLRGVHPRDVSRYSGSEFTCLDGSQRLPLASVNDDYCDCPDGSDEPGTGACANSHFWCRNRGAAGRLLPSSRVNDGLCDCCDGSDEVAGLSPVECPDTCEEAGRAAREAAQAELASVEAGLTARATLLARSSEQMEVSKAKLIKYERLLGERRALLDATRAEKEAQEAIEQAERDKRAADKAAADATAQAQAEAAQAQQQEGQQQPPQDAAATDAVPASPATDAAAPSAAATDTAAAATPASDSAATPAAPAAAAPAENFPYPAEYAYHPNQADSAATGASETQAAAAAKPTENFPYPAEYAYHEGASDAATLADEQAFDAESESEALDDGMLEPEYFDEGDDGLEEGDYEPEGEQGLQTEQKEEEPYVHQEAEVARGAFAAIEQKVKSLQKKYDELKARLSRDYGASHELAHLSDRCFDLPNKQYTYEVCPYARAAQKEGSGSTSLGSFSALERDDKGAYAMKFTGGQSCWQGPQRSLTLRFRCGADEKLVDVNEPSKCVYEMTLQTPAVCDEQHAHRLRTRLHGGADEHMHDEL